MVLYIFIFFSEKLQKCFKVKVDKWFACFGALAHNTLDFVLTLADATWQPFRCTFMQNSRAPNHSTPVIGYYNGHVTGSPSDKKFLHL